MLFAFLFGMCSLYSQSRKQVIEETDKTVAGIKSQSSGFQKVEQAKTDSGSNYAFLKGMKCSLLLFTNGKRVCRKMWNGFT
jgi:hypothetical protein